MNRTEYQTGLLQCWLLARALSQMPLEQMAEAVRRAETVAPVSNPMLYLEKAEAFHQDADVISVLLEAKRTLLRKIARLDELSAKAEEAAHRRHGR